MRSEVGRGRPGALTPDPGPPPSPGAARGCDYTSQPAGSWFSSVSGGHLAASVPPPSADPPAAPLGQWRSSGVRLVPQRDPERRGWLLHPSTALSRLQASRTPSASSRCFRCETTVWSTGRNEQLLIWGQLRVTLVQPLGQGLALTPATHPWRSRYSQFIGRETEARLCWRNTCPTEQPPD